MGIARAGSNPATIAATRHTKLFLPSAALGPCHHVRIVAEVPMLFSVEASTSDFDSDIPGSNPGRATRRNSTVAVHRTCNAKVLSSILSCGLAADAGVSTSCAGAREVQGVGFRHQCVRTRGFKSRPAHTPDTSAARRPPNIFGSMAEWLRRWT